MPKNNSKASRTFRKAEAEERQVKRESRSNEQQIAALDARLGAGLGATWERARLSD